MGILENLKRRFGMAKRFRGGIKEDIVKEVEEIAERVAEEDIEEIPAGMGDEEYSITEGRKSKEEFLISKGLHDRPNSHLAMKAYEEYCETSKSGIR